MDSGGKSMRFGPNNNAKLWPIDRPEGLDPDQEKRPEPNLFSEYVPKGEDLKTIN